MDVEMDYPCFSKPAARSTPLISSPIQLQRDSTLYWKNKYEQMLLVYNKNLEKAIQLENITDLMKSIKSDQKAVKRTYKSLKSTDQ